MSNIIGVERGQVLIESIEEYVDKDSEVRAIDKLVDSLDLNSLGFKVVKNLETGRPNYDLKDILKLYIYGIPQKRMFKALVANTALNY